MIKDITHIGSHITFHCVLRHSQNFSTRNQAVHRMRGTERKKNNNDYYAHHYTFWNKKQDLIVLRAPF